MTDLECLIEWLKTYDGYDILGSCQVDYTDQIPNQGFVFPQGLVEVERREDILGNVTLTDRYNFWPVFYVLRKAPAGRHGSPRQRKLGDGLPALGTGTERPRACAELWQYRN